MSKPFKRVKWSEKLRFGSVTADGKGVFMGAGFEVSGYRHSGGPSVRLEVVSGPLAGRTFERFSPVGTMRSVLRDVIREFKVSVYTEVVGNHPMHDNVG